MRLAIPTKDNYVDDHFGHCSYYTIVEIEENKIILQEKLDAPEGCGCKSNISSVLQTMGVTLMLAGNMGEGAKRVLESHSISVIRGCKGLVSDLIESYMRGEINDSGEGCHHHEDGHVCTNY